MLVKNRDGHIIKVEGNPRHPVNGGGLWGKLCPRGQASVQGIYNPDRYAQPMARDAGGKMRPVSWEEAFKRAAAGLKAAGQKGVVFMSHLMTGTEGDLARWWADRLGGQYVVYEPFAYESLKKANQAVFGTDRIPNYRIDRADFLLSFGADFLETWISNVQFTRQFAAFHEPKQKQKNLFVYVGPRLSMTAANADYWVSVPVGGQRWVALGILNVLARQGRTSIQGAMPADISAFTPQIVEERTGVKADLLTKLAQHFSGAQRPLALTEGMSLSDPDAYETAVAANILCGVKPGSRQLLDFSNPVSLSDVAPGSDITALADRMAAGGVGAVVLYHVNPVYNLPASRGIEKALAKVPTVICLSSFPDETSQSASLVMPSDTFLESWGDYSPQANVTGLLQPAMGRLFNTMPLGDILLTPRKGSCGAGDISRKRLL